MATNYTKEELFELIPKLKLALERKINLEYLPLQRKMNEAESRGDFKTFVELEGIIAPIRAEVIKGYDELLMIRDTYKNLVSQK